MRVKLSKVQSLRERVDRKQVRCMLPGCLQTAVQVISLQFDSKMCFCIIACPEHSLSAEELQEFQSTVSTIPNDFGYIQ